jgi:RNA polymerase sigma-70 factor (ECF subfamily)
VIFSIFKNKDFTAFNDETLMLHVANGQREAFNELYARYSKKLFHYFFQLLNKNKSKAEDFTQDLFIKVIQSAHLFNADKKLSTWLYTIANNMCRNEWRNQSNRTAIINKLELEHIEHQNLQHKLDQKLLFQRLETEISKLPEQDQTLIALRFQQELSIQQIALIIEVPEGTVKSRLYYLMKKLSIQLKEFSPNYQ